MTREQARKSASARLGRRIDRWDEEDFGPWHGDRDRLADIREREQIEELIPEQLDEMDCLGYSGCNRWCCDCWCGLCRHCKRENPAGSPG